MMSLFNKSKETIIYVHMIRKAKRVFRQKGGGTYYEKHHILPKSLGGTNRKSNLVLLTAQEHFRAHFLLPEMVTSGQHRHKMACALVRMIYGTSGKKWNGAFRFSLFVRQNMKKATTGENNPMFGRRHTEEARRKCSISKIGANHPLFSGFYHTPWGKFESSHQAAIASDGHMAQPAVHRYCGNSHTIITRSSFLRNPYLRKYQDETVIGKTWRSVNFFFESA